MVPNVVGSSELEENCAGVLRESLLMPFVLNGNETILWREKECSRVMDGQP